MTKLKTGIAVALLTSFTLVCLLMSAMILFGLYGEWEMKFLFTSVAVGAYSLLGLVLTTQRRDAAVNNKQRLGITTGVLGLCIALLFIWNVLGFQSIPLDLVVKAITFFFIVTVVLTYAHLFSFVPVARGEQRIIQLLTKLSLFVLTIMMLVVLVLPLSVDLGDAYFIIAGILAFIVAVGGLATYLLAGQERAKIWDELQ